MFHSHWNYIQKPPLRGRPNTKPGDHGTPNVHNRWFILFYHVWGPEWIEIYWNSIWLRDQSYMTSHYTWGSMTRLHNFGGVLGAPLDTFFWALTISCSRLLARVWSGPKPNCYCVRLMSAQIIGISLATNFWPKSLARWGVGGANGEVVREPPLLPPLPGFHAPTATYAALFLVLLFLSLH